MSGAGAIPADLGVPPELVAVLGDIAALRTGLEVDLSLAAGALDAGAPQVAARVLRDGRREVAAVARRCLLAMNERPAAWLEG